MITRYYDSIENGLKALLKGLKGRPVVVEGVEAVEVLQNYGNVYLNYHPLVSSRPGALTVIESLPDQLEIGTLEAAVEAQLANFKGEGITALYKERLREILLGLGLNDYQMPYVISLIGESPLVDVHLVIDAEGPFDLEGEKLRLKLTQEAFLDRLRGKVSQETMTRYKRRIGRIDPYYYDQILKASDPTDSLLKAPLKAEVFI